MRVCLYHKLGIFRLFIGHLPVELRRDIDIVKDASSKEKELVPGYNVCEAVILGKREKQPISVYSKIYSCKSNSFVSKKTYTFESIDAVVETLNRQCTFVADRAYDDKKIYKYIEKKNVIL